MTSRASITETNRLRDVEAQMWRHRTRGVAYRPLDTVAKLGGRIRSAAELLCIKVPGASGSEAAKGFVKEERAVAKKAAAKKASAKKATAKKATKKAPAKKK